MSNRLNKKTIDNIDNIEVIQQPKARKAKPKPKPKHEFSEAAREGWLAYQDLRDDNKILTRLNKKYSITTLKRRQELKEKLASNPIFISDYKKLLETYKKNIKVDEADLEILEIFEYKPLHDKELE
jgi:hypothetical protein